MNTLWPGTASTPWMHNHRLILHTLSHQSYCIRRNFIIALSITFLSCTVEIYVCIYGFVYHFSSFISLSLCIYKLICVPLCIYTTSSESNHLYVGHLWHWTVHWPGFDFPKQHLPPPQHWETLKRGSHEGTFREQATLLNSSHLILVIPP